MAYCYLLTHYGMHKIGVTEDLERRLYQLRPAKLVAKKKCDDPFALELKLHRHFAKRRLPQSEWFKLDKFQVKECLAIMGVETRKWYEIEAAKRRNKKKILDESKAKARYKKFQNRKSQKQKLAEQRAAKI